MLHTFVKRCPVVDFKSLYYITELLSVLQIGLIPNIYFLIEDNTLKQNA